MVTSSLTGWERRVRVTVSGGISPDSGSWEKSGKSMGFRRREVLEDSSCSAVKAGG